MDTCGWNPHLDREDEGVCKYGVHRTKLRAHNQVAHFKMLGKEKQNKSKESEQNTIRIKAWIN